MEHLAAWNTDNTKDCPVSRERAKGSIFGGCRTLIGHITIVRFYIICLVKSVVFGATMDWILDWRWNIGQESLVVFGPVNLRIGGKVRLLGRLMEQQFGQSSTKC